jgi:hypothetical protein
MARLLVAGLLGAAAFTPLLAQPARPVAPMQPPATVMINGARPGMATMTRAQAQGMADVRFMQRDTNRDGFLSADELQARTGRRANVMMRRRGPDGAPRAMGDAGAAFDRLDANRDGAITRDEFGKAREVRIEKRVMVDGAMAPPMPGAPGQQRQIRIIRHGGGMGGGMAGAAMLNNADANRDGRVSRAEATGAALRHFDMIDTNRDGLVTPQERAAGRQHMMHMRNPG